MLSTPNLVFIDRHLSHKVTVFIHDANWKSSGIPFLERGVASVVE